ncbi:MAG: carboxylesterase family protein [Flavobacteriaceae bacterium]|nr:carboxylesterase family protein [Flavobacteriaceae bacterium]
MSDYWTNFIKTGNPNGTSLPQWPQFTTDKKEIIFLGKEITSDPMPDAERLEFLYGVLTK